MKNRILKICGESSVRPDFNEIANTPNFVFTPDPNFETVTLFDSVGNVVNLNSWIECAFYVNGGWTNNVSDFYNGEKSVFIFVSLVFLTHILYIKYFKKINFSKFVEFNEE